MFEVKDYLAMLEIAGPNEQGKELRNDFNGCFCKGIRQLIK